MFEHIPYATDDLDKATIFLVSAVVAGIVSFFISSFWRL